MEHGHVMAALRRACQEDEQTERSEGPFSQIHGPERQIARSPGCHELIAEQDMSDVRPDHHQRRYLANS